MDLLLEDSIWSVRPLTAEAAAVEVGAIEDHPLDPMTPHVETLTRWLMRAGAEPRLVLVLCSGAEAKGRFATAVGNREIDVVKAPATPADAIHPRVRMHEGDHFNRTLFLMDGFEAGDPTSLFEKLDRQTSMLARQATWVAVVIESVQALQCMAQTAPNLMKAFHRHCLVLDETIDNRDAPGMALSADAQLVASWRAEQAVACLLYLHAMTPDAAPDYDDWSRLVRSGYAVHLTGHQAHPDRRRLVQLWDTGPALAVDAEVPFDVSLAGPGLAEAVARHVVRPSGRKSLGERCVQALVEHPTARYAGDLTVEDVEGLQLMARVRAAAQGGAAVTDADRKSLADLGQAQAIGANLAVHVYLTLANEAATRGDLEACDMALAQADRLSELRQGVAPELAFEVADKMARMHMWQHRTREGRGTLEKALGLVHLAHSPFYRGRGLLLQGDLTRDLDPTKARQYYTEAERIFSASGYPREVMMAREGLEALNDA
ncbi:MAG: hypothetical protein ACE366_25535 [Bradymonadia bacterium]